MDNTWVDTETGSLTKPEDSSLQAKAYERAMQGKRPRTLTPWEWEEWYATNGMPEEFNGKSEA